MTLEKFDNRNPARSMRLRTIDEAVLSVALVARVWRS